MGAYLTALDRLADAARTVDVVVPGHGAVARGPEVAARLRPTVRTSRRCGRGWSRWTRAWHRTGSPAPTGPTSSRRGANPAERFAAPGRPHAGTAAWVPEGCRRSLRLAGGGTVSENLELLQQRADRQREKAEEANTVLQSVEARLSSATTASDEARRERKRTRSARRVAEQRLARLAKEEKKARKLAREADEDRADAENELAESRRTWEKRQAKLAAAEADVAAARAAQQVESSAAAGGKRSGSAGPRAAAARKTTRKAGASTTTATSSTPRKTGSTRGRTTGSAAAKRGSAKRTARRQS